MKPIHMAGPQVTEADVQIVLDALRNGWYDKPYYYVEAFQKEFAEYHGRKYGIMTPNCTTAIHLLLTALGIGSGDEVIIPECTWIATAAPVTYLKATPVFCDIEEDSWCIDPVSVEKSITSKTKAIIAVDLFGNMARMDELSQIAKKHGLFLIEDSAEALGSKLNEVRAGKFGIGSVFSFHRTKTLTTGEGGMLLLDDDALYERCMFLRDHGRKTGGPMYYNFEVTYKYMPFNVQAALGYAQFKRLDELVGKKREIFFRYKNNLRDLKDIQFNAEPENVYNSVWITGLVFGKSHQLTKQDAIDKLKDLGAPVRPFFYPLSMLPAYPGFEQQYRTRNLKAYDISSRGINLPGALNLENDQIDFVCEQIRKLLSK